MSFDLLLASGSPRRLELLRGLGLAVRVRPSGVPEPDGPAPDPVGLARALARAKARHVASSASAEATPSVVLGADTVVALDGDTLGKPRDEREAREMLRRLAGKTHRVITGVHLVRTDVPREASVAETTRVRFRDYDERTIDWYVSSGESRDKAGAYGIQGRGVLLVEAIEGSWSNVVGLPLERLPGLFEEIGLDLLAALRV